MKKSEGHLDASPQKRLYHSIISDYTPELSIFELIDNAIDNGQINKLDKIFIKIELDDIENSIRIIDNSGGIQKEKLKVIVSPGSTGNTGNEESIGIFGVGSKRGVISLAQKISITSRYLNKETYLVEYDDEWIGDEENWDVEYFKVDNINEGTTIVELNKLRGVKVNEILLTIKNKIGKVYGILIDSGLVNIEVNGNAINSILPENDWSYPENFSPKKLIKKHIFDGQEVNYVVFVGLTRSSSPQGKYGVTFYGNNRLICEYKKDEEVGYTTGKAGNSHSTKSLCQVIVYFSGPSKLIPWNSSKSGINYQSNVYKGIISDEIIHSVIEYSKASVFLSKSEGSWTKNVLPFNKGKIEVISLNEVRRGKSYSLPIGKVRKTKSEKLLDDNLSKLDSKEWCQGLVESFIAIDKILKLNLLQKNRIAFIILDSNLEIGMKEYLVHELRIGNEAFNKIKENRTDVILRIKNENKTNTNLCNLLDKTNFYYLKRNDLVHQKATANIIDKEIDDYQIIVKGVFKELFGLIF